MANPNIVNVTTILANNSLTDLTTTSATAVVNNPAGSGKVYKVNSLIVSNKDSANVYAATISLYSADDVGGTAYSIANLIDIPATASLIVIDKNTSYYIKEDQSIGVTANNANRLVATASWEEIS